MDHLLRDGGDLDSMDRSLLDYNHASQKVAVISSSSHAHNGNGHTLESPNNQQPQIEHLPPVTPPNTALVLSPATPTTSPSSEVGGVSSVLPVIKRDLVVRFTEQQNSVRCEMARKGVVAHPARGAENHAPNVNVKAQYEAQHYSRHPHGPMSPCDSESSVCNRSKENLLSQGNHHFEYIRTNP